MNEDWFNGIAIWNAIALSGTIIADMADYMPDMVVSDWFKELRTDYGLMIDFDFTRMVGFVESLTNLEKYADTLDLRPAQVRKGYREITTTPTYYLITQPADGDDHVWDNETPPVLQVGDYDRAITATNITLASVTTQMITEVAASDALLFAPILANWKIPHIKQSIFNEPTFTPICAVNSNDRYNFKLRFIYYAGMRPNSNGFPYPFGTVDNIDATGTVFTTLNLSMSPAVNDYSPLLNFYNFVLNSKPFEMGFMLSKEQLMKCRANVRYLVRDPYNFATISGIVDQVAADLQEMQKEIGTKITLYPIVRPNNPNQVLPPVVTPPVTPPVDNGLVYVRFSEINQTTTDETEPTSATITTRDLVVSFWEDSAGTVPKSVTGLPVGFSTALTSDPAGTTVTSFVTNSCTGTTHTLLTAAPVSENLTDGSGLSYVWVYTLLSSAYYTIIS